MKFQFKKIYLLPLLIFGSALLFSFIEDGAPTPPPVYNSDPDTLSTSSSLDTSIFSIGTFYSPLSYALQVSADSLTGATDATCYLQVNLDMGGSDWATLQTITVDGTTTRSYTTGSIARGTLRCACYAPSSTQSTAVRVDFAYP